MKRKSGAKGVLMPKSGIDVPLLIKAGDSASVTLPMLWRQLL
jgi:hypothetical protein